MCLNINFLLLVWAKLDLVQCMDARLPSLVILDIINSPRTRPSQDSTWLQKCYRADTVNVNNAVICEQHFSSAQIKRNLKYELLGSPVPRSWRDLKTEAVPNQNLPFRGHDNGSGLSAENTGKET